MRLIDADELLEKLLSLFNWKIVGTDEVKYVVDNMPTVEQKYGHWEWQKGDIYRCSECGEDIQVKEVMNIPQYKCCPMCMAIMSPDRGKEV